MQNADVILTPATPITFPPLIAPDLLLSGESSITLTITLMWWEE